MTDHRPNVFPPSGGICKADAPERAGAPQPWIMHERTPQFDNEEGQAYTAKLVQGDKWLLGRQYRTHDRYGPQRDAAENELWIEYRRRRVTCD